MEGLLRGEDGIVRCAWGAEPEIYRRYHDEEWGRPVHGDDAIFERLTLEAFQSGLSWLTILRKREAFRTAFADFSIAAVAAFGAADVSRLLNDACIVRNRAKVAATIANARAASTLLEVEGAGALDSLVWAHRPEVTVHAGGPIPAFTSASTALAHALRKRGFAFVGPTTAYAAMQAVGIVNDHLPGCATSPLPAQRQGAATC